MDLTDECEACKSIRKTHTQPECSIDPTGVNDHPTSAAGWSRLLQMRGETLKVETEQKSWWLEAVKYDVGYAAWAGLGQWSSREAAAGLPRAVAERTSAILAILTGYSRTQVYTSTGHL